MNRRALMTLAVVALALPASASARLGVSVFARVPAPGYPADALVAAAGTVYAGTFHSFSGGADNGPSKVFAFSPSGKLERTFTITGQTPGTAHGVQVAATDQSGVLYLLDQAPARVLKLNPFTGAQTTWATFSTVPACPSSGPNGDCTEGPAGNAPEPDFAAWGPDGSLYVTDYAQSLIWRVPPGGGKATVWLTSTDFNGVVVGPAGLELMPGGHQLMFDTGGGGSNIAAGKLYTVPIEPDGRPGPLRELWESGQAEAPDGFAIARSGDIYVALVGPSGNAVVELAASGSEIARVPANALANDMLPIPFDAPGSVTFDGDDILVGNQSAIAGNTSNMALLEVDVGEPGLPLALPPPPPVSYRLRVRPSHLEVDDPTRLTFTATTATGIRRGPVAHARVEFDGRQLRTGRHGRAFLRLDLRHPRRYRARLFVHGRAVATALVTARVALGPGPVRPSR
jgi:hypothetical protein